MWDVIWTDPDKELVGEHRARKERKETPQKEPKSQPRRRSASTASSRWSTDSPFAIFRNRGAKKANTASSNAHTMSPTSSGLESPALLSPDRSPIAKMFDQGSRRNSSRISTSFLDRLASIDSPLNTSPLIPDKSLDADSHQSSSSHSSTSRSSPTARPPSSAPAAPILSINSLQMAQVNTEVPITPNNPEAWKPLDDWEPRPLLEESPEPTFESGDPNQLPTDGIGINKNFCWLRATVVEMAETSVPEILSRLETVWKGVAKKDVPFLLGDSPEVEELRRWMLSTMIHMDKVPTRDAQWLPRRISPLTARMTISLYDSAATVAYLAALEPTKQIYHVSQLSTPRDELFANVRVISVSQVSPTDFPVAPRIYESVHSLTLPSLCPSAQLPGILGNVYKCLKKKGFLRLVIIDPLPRTGTMGRNMKGWIEEHLLRNLAKQGKCLSPSTAFPPLLAEARLRGDGSTLTTTKFYAVPESATEYLDKVKDAIQAENEDKAQVRSLIGRMLWVEAWGPHVTGNRWWWDDPACVAECLEMGTFWEYHTVKGVKEVDEATKAA
ncbi:hypothetical protein M419DRAFT_86253 [Trichoderma reesei RUT C-30]|uniref:Uncharacterized protein n=1 Tax=Hypocrea jecorina (strain ATCC 56765 / BCRC 32924 / NRRL 11460 / Rut C-30) TaxID=1344414 RepID=A0A024S2A9_HYPJR|nr:hypothetical protein M419DRAFT_86253 [Trichoderma reesei RUT C-30]